MEDVSNRVDIYPFIDVEYSDYTLVSHAGIIIDMFDTVASVAIQLLITGVLHRLLSPPISLPLLADNLAQFNFRPPEGLNKVSTLGNIRQCLHLFHIFTSTLKMK